MNISVRRLLDDALIIAPTASNSAEGVAGVTPSFECLPM
jgi:hypothetical protein